jgi:DNA-binding GntR family transcriptional regulator
LNTIEKSFGFHDVIKREAMIGLEAIREMSIVSNIGTLEELIDNVGFARRLTKIARNSPVIRNNIPNANIISFSMNHPAVRNKMRYTPDGSQFALDTKVSKDLFIKLLNDDFLTSELTSLYYDSLAKDNIETENEQEANDVNE